MRDGIRFAPAVKATMDAKRPDANRQGYVRVLMAKARGVLGVKRNPTGVQRVPNRRDARERGRLRQAPIGPGIHGRMADRRKAPSSFTRSVADPKHAPATHAARRRAREAGR